MKFKFDQIAINSTAKKKPEPEDAANYIGLEHLIPGTFEISEWGSSVAPVGEKLLMKKGDVLFGRRRAYQRKVGIAPFDGIFSAHGMVLRPRTEVVDENYFPFFILSDQFMNEAVRISVGSLSPTINWGTLKNCEFDLPSMEEQKKLAELLWAANDLKEKYKKAITATDEMLKAKFREMFGCVGNGERGMGNGEDFNAETQRRRGKRERGKLRDLTEGKIELAAVKYGPNDEFSYIDISSVSGTFDGIGACGKYLQRNAPSRAQQCVKRGDILLSLVRPNLRKMAIVDFDDDNHVASTGFCVIRPKPEAVGYLKLLLTSEEFTNAMMDVARGTSYPAVTNRNVMDFQIPLPPLALQREFVAIAEKAEAAKAALKKSIADIDQVMKGLINNG